MFATKRMLQANAEWTQRELNNLQDKYWSLWHKHELLLKHFGLTEHTDARDKGVANQGRA